MTRDLVILSGSAHLVLYLLCFFLLPRLFKNRNGYKSLGEKLMAAKEKQLKTNPLLRYFSRSVEQQNIGIARCIIAGLIFLKAMAMALVGITGATLILVPVQAVMMASLTRQIQKRGIPNEDLSRVTGFQLATMIIGAATGNLIGWRLFIDDLTLTTTLNQEFNAIIIMLLAMLFLSWLTAGREVKFYRNNQRLIS